MTDTIRIPVGPSGAIVGWATVDAGDYERLIVHRWYRAGRGYAFRAKDGKSNVYSVFAGMAELRAAAGFGRVDLRKRRVAA